MPKASDPKVDLHFRDPSDAFPFDGSIVRAEPEVRVSENRVHFSARCSGASDVKSGFHFCGPIRCLFAEVAHPLFVAFEIELACGGHGPRKILRRIFHPCPAASPMETVASAGGMPLMSQVRGSSKSLICFSRSFLLKPCELAFLFSSRPSGL
jgi:hypothetical protein